MEEKDYLCTRKHPTDEEYGNNNKKIMTKTIEMENTLVLTKGQTILAISLISFSILLKK